MIRKLLQLEMEMQRLDSVELPPSPASTIVSRTSDFRRQNRATAIAGGGTTSSSADDDEIQVLTVSAPAAGAGGRPTRAMPSSSSATLASSGSPTASHSSATTVYSAGARAKDRPAGAGAAGAGDSSSLGGSSSNRSRWQRLLGAFRRSKHGAGGAGKGNPEDAHKRKHSHNCSNAVLRAGISNMKGYKKVNQDR